MSLENVKYGFYASNNHDRVYDSDDFSKVFSALIEDGVFSKIGDHFAVTPSSGLTVRIGTGMAWFNNTWTLLEQYGYMTLSSAHNTMSRIDAIVITVNKATRVNSIDIIQGTNSNDPVNPALTSDQHPIAFIKVRAGATALTAGDITQAVPETTGYVTGPLRTLYLPEVLAGLRSNFDEWFETIRDRLDTADVARLEDEILARVPLSNNPAGLFTVKNLNLTFASGFFGAFEYAQRSSYPIDPPRGYTPIGIVGFYTNKAAVTPTTYRLTNNNTNLECGLKNTTNKDIPADVNVTFYILCVKNTF